MRPTSLRLALALALASLGYVACGPEVTTPTEPSAPAKEYARRICEAGTACGCFTPAETEAGCVEALAERFDALLADPNLELDETCLDLVLDEQGSCASFRDFPADARCTAFQGDTALGRTCSPRPDAPVYVDECEAAASCNTSEGICVDGVSGQPKNEGEPCRADLPTSCSNFGLYCAADGRCHRAATEGEPCESFLGCWEDGGPDLYCSGWWASGTGVCRRASQLGETCEPRESGSCTSTGTRPQDVWCDPSSSTCVEGQPPAVCGVVWPSRGSA